MKQIAESGIEEEVSACNEFGSRVENQPPLEQVIEDGKARLGLDANVVLYRSIINLSEGERFAAPDILVNVVAPARRRFSSAFSSTLRPLFDTVR